MAKKLTPAQLAKNEVDTAIASAHFRGVIEGRETAIKETQEVKLAQIRAATELLEQAGRIMSRAGYMIGKINGDNGR